MTFKDEEAKAHAEANRIMASLNSTEATWLAWAKAHKWTLALYAAAAVIAIWTVVKLIKLA